MIRTYSELVKLPTFEERFEYLKLNGSIAKETFGYERYLNQKFYRSDEWRRIRNIVIARDLGRDLGVEGYELDYGIQIHHMNPVTKDDILSQSQFLLNPEFLICVSESTHKAIHYGSVDSTIQNRKERCKYDTCPWKKEENNKCLS